MESISNGGRATRSGVPVTTDSKRGVSPMMSGTLVGQRDFPL